MKVVAGLLVGLWLCASPAHADEAHDLAVDIVNKTDATHTLDQVLILLRASLVRSIAQKSGKSEQQAASIVDQILLPGVHAAIPRIKAIIVSIYVKNYDLADLRGLDAFYATTLGQHLVAKSPQIAAEMTPAIIGAVRNAIMQAIQDRAQDLRQRGVTL